MSGQRASFSELANTPLEVELDGRVLKVRRISLDALLGKAESHVVSEHMKRIKSMADSLLGEERTSFMAQAMQIIPTGVALVTEAADFLRTPSGIKTILVEALRKDQPDIERTLDISKLVREELDFVRTVSEYLLGTPMQKEEKQDQSNPLSQP